MRPPEVVTEFFIGLDAPRTDAFRAFLLQIEDELSFFIIQAKVCSSPQNGALVPLSGCLAGELLPAVYAGGQIKLLRVLFSHVPLQRLLTCEGFSTLVTMGQVLADIVFFEILPVLVRHRIMVAGYHNFANLAGTGYHNFANLDGTGYHNSANLKIFRAFLSVFVANIEEFAARVFNYKNGK